MRRAKNRAYRYFAACTTEDFVSGKVILSSFHSAIDLRLRYAALALARMGGAWLTVWLLYAFTPEPVCSIRGIHSPNARAPLCCQVRNSPSDPNRHG